MNDVEKIYFLLEAFSLWDDTGGFEFPDGTYLVREEGFKDLYLADEEEQTIEKLISSAEYWGQTY